MSVLTTIELKQLAGRKNGETGGDWSNTLMKPIYIEDGDIVSLDKVFIDSTSQNTNSIYVKNDLSMEFNCMIYNQNITGTEKTYGDISAVDGEKYLMCSVVSHTPSPGSDLEEILTVSFSNHIGGPIPGKWAGFTLKYSYLDATGTLAYWHHTVNIIDWRIETLTVPINVIAKKNTFLLISPSVDDMYNTYNTVYGGVVTGAVTASNIYTPIIVKKTITLPAGNYDPIYIAKFITDGLTRNNRNANNPSKAFIPISNEFLFSSDGLAAGTFFINCETAGGSFQYVPVNSGDPGMWIGTNQFALQYDNEQHFYFSDLHIPIYSDGGLKVCQFIPLVTTGDFMPVSSAGGVLIHSIRCFDKDSDHIPFFEDTLGFDMGTITPSITQTNTVIQVIESSVPILNLINGVNFTEGLISLDMGIQKNSASEVCPSTASLVNNIQEQTSPIYSQSISGDTKATNTGYYQIEINSVFHSTFVGDKVQKNNISGIVSRYFTQNSYTSGSSDSSIPYIHRGQPTQLKGFSIRILDSNGNLAEDLNDDNTVILRVTKPMKKETK